MLPFVSVLESPGLPMMTATGSVFLVSIHPTSIAYILYVNVLISQYIYA
jgi:hypothetical protein